MSDAPLSPLASSELMPDLLTGFNVANGSSTQAIGINRDNNNIYNNVNASFDVQNYASGNIALSTTQHLSSHSLKIALLSSSSDSEDDEMSAYPNGSLTNGGGDAGRSVSPPPNCAICLSRCKNKCFTDSCMHQFCFKCLCEWSKVKPECPLCKQTFKSIIHNVKSIDQFEEYHIQSPTAGISSPTFDLDSFGLLSYGNRYVIVSSQLDFPRTRNSMVLASGPTSSRNTGSNGNPFDESRLSRRYPVCIIDGYYRRHPSTVGDESISRLWRNYIYDRKMYALPVCDVTGQFRESSARFYRDHPAQIHRLLPWIRRDVECLVDGILIQRDEVVQSIAEALTFMNILSTLFKRRIQRYLGVRASHFIHELHNFARSPYDMIGYDRVVRYSPQVQQDLDGLSLSESSDSDNNTAARRNCTTVTSTVTSESQTVGSAINLSIHNRANYNRNFTGRISGIIDLADDSDNNNNNNDAEPSTSRQQLQQTENLSPVQNICNEHQNQLQRQLPLIMDNIELSSASSECEFVLERKPPHLRTPEMVTLDSDTDSDVVFVNEVRGLKKSSFSTSEDDDAMDAEGDPGASINSPSPTFDIPAMTLNDETKKQQQCQHLKCNDSCKEIFNVGASTSSGLRSTGSIRRRDDSVQTKAPSMPFKKHDEHFSRHNNVASVPDAISNKMYRRLRKNRSRRLKRYYSTDSTSSDSSSASSTSTFISSSNGSVYCPTSSDEDFVPSHPKTRHHHKRYNRTKIENRQQRNISYKRRSICKRQTTKSKSKYDKVRCANDDGINNLGSSKRSKPTSDVSKNTNNIKKHALTMALGGTLKRKINGGRKQLARLMYTSGSDGESSWRSDAVSKSLKKEHEQDMGSSFEMIQKQNDITNDQSYNIRGTASATATRMTIVTATASATSKTTEFTIGERDEKPSTKYGQSKNITKHYHHQMKQEHQEKSMIPEYMGDEDDDDIIDNLNLSVLKSILKAERSNDLVAEEMNNGLMESGESQEQDEVMLPERSFQVNEQNELNATNTPLQGATDDVEMSTPDIKDNNQFILNSHNDQYQFSNEAASIELNGNNSSRPVSLPSSLADIDSIQATTSSSMVNIIHNSSVDDNNINIMHNHNNNINSNIGQSSVDYTNNQNLSALLWSPYTSTLTYSSSAFKKECQMDIPSEENHLNYQNIHYTDHKRDNSSHDLDHHRDDDDNSTNNSIGSTVSINSNPSTDTASSTTADN